MVGACACKGNPCQACVLASSVHPLSVVFPRFSPISISPAISTRAAPNGWPRSSSLTLQRRKFARQKQMTAIGKGSWLANTQLDLVQQTGITQILMPACPVANCSHYVYTNRLSAPLPAWGHHGPSAATHFASYWRLDNQII